MNRIKFLLPILFLFFISCEKKESLLIAKNFSKVEKVSDTIQQIDTVLLGDLNSDAIKDTVFVFYPKMVNGNPKDQYDGDCLNNICDVTFKFSNNLPEFKYGDAIGSGIDSIGDVNKDGISELVIYPYWFIGCWGKMHFYTYKNNSWNKFGEARTDICDDSIYKNRIKIVSKNKISVLEKFNIDGDPKFKRKTIKLE
jgi:hypothetical protein